MEEQGASFPSFFCPGSALHALLLLLVVTLLLLLLDVDDSGSAMTVDDTKDVSVLGCDCVGTGLDIIGDDTDGDAVVIIGGSLLPSRAP